MRKSIVCIFIMLMPLVASAQSSFGNRTGNGTTQTRQDDKDKQGKQPADGKQPTGNSGNKPNGGKDHGHGMDRKDDKPIAEFHGEENLYVDVRRAGQLDGLIGENRNFVRHLKIRGVLDYRDIEVIRKIGARTTCYSHDKNHTCRSYLEVDMADAFLEDGTRLDFSYATRMETIRLPRNTRAISNRAFAGCWDLKYVAFPREVTSIGESAFEDCHNLESIELPSVMKSIGRRAFRGCRMLTDIILPEGISNLADQVLENTRISQIVIPSTVQTIGSGVFDGTLISRLDIPAGVSKIALDAFYGMPRLTMINVAAGNANYDSDGQVLFDKQATTVLFAVRSFEGTFTVPDGFVSIAPYALSGCAKITDIVLPSSVTVIGNYAFAKTGMHSFQLPFTVEELGVGIFKNCSLQQVDLPDNLTSIPENMFYGCDSLLSVHIPETVTSIGKKAFADCSCLGNVTLPKGLLTIADRAFDGCKSMTEFRVPSEQVQFGNKVLYGCTSLQSLYVPYTAPTKHDNVCDNKRTVLYVPVGTAAVYKKLKGWKKFKSIQEVL